MFEITPQDIAQLDDKQLRALIGLLCEAELRKRGLSTNAITWGGDQNAADGGLDVRVDLSNSHFIDDFIPRQSTGFQVKKQDMPARAIANEMRPNGKLRSVFHELAERHGAYIIVSSQGSTSDIALTNRKMAMASAARELAGQIHLDFYDRTRVASWVRNHAGLVIWVRQRIGRIIAGWEPFGAWSYPAGGIEANYLIEKDVYIRARSSQLNTNFSAEEGLNRIRQTLLPPQSVVRLVGLSGVGKTRFVQALFDSRIGDKALDPALVIYTNMNNNPEPQPFSLASDLIADASRAILIIDNCGADLHARLSTLVKTRSSSLSILTVEYDIRDDQPEGTEVFEIQVASIELTQKLLQKRFPNLSQIDRKTAAEFSGGNARIAIALADTVSRGRTLASLNDTQLFERLFVQRQEQNQSLLHMAQACALFYSFNGEDLSNSEEGELSKIASLIDVTLDQAYRAVAELLRRDLAQRRGPWRAILPHALANRLAITALENIPSARMKLLINGAPKRLIISFSRRLGYLNTSKEAASIVEDWFDPNGWIGAHVWNLNEFGESVFKNSLPANPEAGLQALERNRPAYGTDTPIVAGNYVLRALRSLAWDINLFERCTTLLQFLAIYGDQRIAKDAAKIHGSLFHILLSGTHATIEQRVAVARRLLFSTKREEQELGLAVLDAMLRSQRFSSSYDFEFGAHSRDYGYAPKTHDEQLNWFSTALTLADETAHTSEKIADAAKSQIAEHFRGLWKIGLQDQLELISKKFAATGFWPDGWWAAKQTRYYTEKDKTSENYARLSKLETALQPCDLVQKIRGQVLTSKGTFYDIDELGDADDGVSLHRAMEKKQSESKALGCDLANDQDALHDLLPELVAGKASLYTFGMGLAEGSKNIEHLWLQIMQQFERTPSGHQNVSIFRGILFELNNQKSNLIEKLLDYALVNKPLASFFPTLQATVDITLRGIDRLIKSLELGHAPIHEHADFHVSVQ
jgi:hypothetical protein